MVSCLAENSSSVPPKKDTMRPVRQTTANAGSAMGSAYQIVVYPKGLTWIRLLPSCCFPTQFSSMITVLPAWMRSSNMGHSGTMRSIQ